MEHEPKTLQERIDAELIKRAEENEGRTRSGKFRTSDLGKCFRAQYLARSGAKPTNPLTIDTLHVFAAGKIVHDYIQQYFPKGETEVKYEDDHFIGYCDLLADTCAYDIKSVNPNYFFHSGFGEKRKTFNVTEIDEIILRKKRNNILQVAQYAAKFNKPKIALCFFSRDLSYGLRVHEWAGLLEHWIIELEAERKTLITAWESKTMPPACPRLYDGREGKYCQFFDKAKGECSAGGKCGQE